MNVLYNFWTQEPKLQQWTRRIWATFVLHAKIFHNNGKFVSSAYRKPTFSSVFTNYKSSIPMYSEWGFLYILFQRSFNVCCNFKTFHSEIYYLKTNVRKNSYLTNFMDLCFKSFLTTFHTTKVLLQNVPKRDVFVKLPFFGSTSFQNRKGCFCQVAVPWKYFVSNSKETSKVISRSPVWVEKLFTFKDKWSEELLLRLRNYKCGGWNATYYGKTKCYFKVRICELLVI